MKRKFFIILFLLTFTITKINASEFNLKFFDFFAIPTVARKAPEEVYCDTKNHWCNDAAQRLYNENIFSGIKIGNNYYFMPDEYITRGEFLLYLNAVLKIPLENDSTLPFADVSTIPDWQLPTVCVMYNNGFVKGNIEKNKLFFNHDEKISRLECAIILNNMLGLKTDSVSTEYYDNYLIPAYASAAVKNVSDYGLMQGYTDNSFRPYIKITRAMLADILCKVKDYNKK